MEVLHTIRPPGVECLQHDLSVAVGEEAVALGLQLRAQLLVVVDAAVEGHGEPQLAIDHRLAGVGAQVDDAQAPVAKGDPPLLPSPMPIRPAGDHTCIHPAEGAEIHRQVIKADFTAKATHQASPAGAPESSNGTEA